MVAYVNRLNENGNVTHISNHVYERSPVNGCWVNVVIPEEEKKI